MRQKTFNLGRGFGWILFSMILLPHLFLKLWAWPPGPGEWGEKQDKGGGKLPPFHVPLRAGIMPSRPGQCVQLTHFSGEGLCSEIAGLLRNSLPVGDVPSHSSSLTLCRPQEPWIPVTSVCTQQFAQVSQSNRAMVPP